MQFSAKERIIEEIMVFNLRIEEVYCTWNILDNSHKVLLGLCQFLFGVLGLILNIWLVVSFLKAPYLTSRSYLFPLMIGLSLIGRNILSGFIVSAPSSMYSRWIFGDAYCHFYAFLRQMLQVFHVWSLTVIALERSLITSRINKKRGELPFKFYISSMIVCWIVSVTFSVLPLVGIGRYGCDTSGTSCELDWNISRNTHFKHLAFNAFTAFFTGVVPFVITAICILKTISSGNKEILPIEVKYTTSAMFYMIVIIFILWIPQIVLTFWIAIGFPYFLKRIPIAVTIMAPLSAEAISFVPVLSFLACDIKLRSALLRIILPKRLTHPKKHVKFTKGTYTTRSWRAP